MGPPEFVGFSSRVAGLGFTDRRFSSGHRQPSSPRQKTWRIGPPATLGSSGFQVFPARQIPPSISHSQLPKSHSLSLSFSLCCSGRRRKNEEEKKNRDGEVERRKKKNKQSWTAVHRGEIEEKEKKEKKRKRKWIREKKRKITKMPLHFSSFICQLLFNPTLKLTTFYPLP